MGKIILFDETTKNPITLIGKMSGVCYDSPIDDEEKNYKRGIHNIKSGHDRCLEFVSIYMIIDGYSARVIRELYTHIGGSPTRVQASTRYINYNDFSYIMPKSVEKDEYTREVYASLMRLIRQDTSHLTESFDIPKEDVANMLPLGMATKMVYKVNLRTLIDMSHQRLCSCAYWEFRQLMNDILDALADYSQEWWTVVNELSLFKRKCEVCGYCNEGKRSCGLRPSEEEYNKWYNEFLEDWRKNK